MAAIETGTGTGKKASENLLAMQAGDETLTYADGVDLIRDTRFKPSTSIETAS
jgi:UDP-glucuronate 4-epimerase